MLRILAVVVVLLMLLGSRVLLQLRDSAPQRPTVFVQNLGGFSSLLFSPNGRQMVASGGSNGTRITLYETGSWRKIRSWQSPAEQMFFSNDSKRLFTFEPSFGQNRDYTFTIWNLADGKRLSSWRLPYSRDGKELPNTKFFSSISSDLSLMVLENLIKAKDKKLSRDFLHIVEADSGKERRVIPRMEPFPDETQWTNNNHWLLITGWKASTQLLRTSDWKAVTTLPPMNYTTTTADLSTFIGVHNDYARKQNGKLVLYDIPTRRTQKIATDFWILRWAYRLDDAIVVNGMRRIQRSGSDYDRNDFIQIRSADGTQIKNEFKYDMLQVGAHRKLLAVEKPVFRDMTYEIHRARDGQMIAQLDADADVLGGNWEKMSWSPRTSEAFSPDGAWFVSGDESGLLRCWRLPSDQ